MLSPKKTWIITRQLYCSILLTGILLFSTPVTLQADGPFGLSMGMTKAEIGTGLKKIALYKYKTTNVPKPHAAFGTYVLKISPDAGLYSIRAISHSISSNSYGAELRSKFNSVHSKLVKLYGKHKMHDFVKPGSVWDEPIDWMMALSKKERVFAAKWSEADGSNLKDNIVTITLFAIALSSTQGVITLEYHFSNEKLVEGEIDAKQAEAF